MRTSFFVILLFSLTAQLVAQPAMPPGMPRSMPLIGRLYGKVVDANSRQPVDYASVTLLAMQKDSVISGCLAQANGDFNLTKLPFGKFRLKVVFIGYKEQVIPVSISPNNIEQDLGNIKLLLDAKSLNEAVVQGEKTTVVMGIDRRVYQVDKDLSAKGGTGIDAVKNIPGLTVDADGGVSMRNGSPIIYIDGRPTTLILEQIPADDIERIEVITNPSAKFEASASAGILNIILKKNTKPGYNGIVMAGFGYPNRYNGMLSLNVKEGKSNFGISYNINKSLNPTKGYTNRVALNNSGEQVSSFNQNNETEMENLMQNGRLSFDYNITNRTTLTISQAFMAGGYDSEDSQAFTQQDSAKQTVLYGNRNTTQKTRWNNATSQVLLRKTFPKKGKEFTTDFNYNVSNRKSNSTFYTYNYNNAGVLLPPGEELQENKGKGSSDMFTFQFDFVNPITDTAKWEFGVRSNYKIENNELEVAIRNNATGEMVKDTALTNNYQINDMVNAAYATYTNMGFGIGYQAGLRFEQTIFRGELLGKNQSFEYLYPNGTDDLAKAFFPSLYLTKRFTEKNEFQLNFSRKINRPNFMQVMPFIMFADKFNYRIGNPSLAPEFINTVEFNYNRILPKGNWFVATYFKAFQDPITQYITPLSTDTTGTILVNTFINGNNQYNYGFETNYKVSLWQKKLDVSVNFNGFYSSINADVNNTTVSNEGFTWNAKALAALKLPKQFTLQANGSYEAPRIAPQGKTLEVYSIDLSLNKEVTKMLNFSLVLNDVFNSRRFGTSLDGDNFEQEISRRRESRFLRLSFTWRFGEMDTSLFRKRSSKRNEGGGNMDMDF